MKVLWQKTNKNKTGLGYLNLKPKFIHWKVIAGERQLSFYEAYDVIFDEKDLKIRKLI